VKELFESGRFVDVALVAIALELLLLFYVRRKTGRGLRPLDVVGHLAAGAILLLALRCVVTGADYRLTLVLLTLSFPAHVYDLLRRARTAL
jgi:hypothetical protein